MVDRTLDPYVAEAAARRAFAAANEEYAVKTQQQAQLSMRTRFVNMDTGEISYVELPSNGPSNAVDSVIATVAVPAAPPSPPIDAATAYRHGRLGVVAVVVLVLFWVWLTQRRSAAS